MPELNAFITPEDFEEIVEGCLAAGCRFVPMRHYEKPEYPELCKLEEIRAQLSDPWLQGWCVVSERWERCKLEVSSFEKDGLRTFFIMERNGGPTIEIYPGRVLQTSTGPMLRCALFAHYPSFWNLVTEQNEPIPQEVVACYKELTRRIKKNSYAVKVVDLKYWVTHRAARSGMRLGAPLEHVDPSTLLKGGKASK